MSGLEEDVLGLDVPVDHALFVGPGQGLAHFPDDCDGLIHRE
jgi:hypothetical protein